MRINKIVKLVIFFSLILAMIINTNAFADLRFIEVDEISESGYLSVGGTTVNGVSPFRNSSLQPIFTRVNTQYSEPRPAADAGMHRGVDLKSVDSSGNSMYVYPIFGAGRICQVDNNQTTSYGKYVKLQHSYSYGGKTYYFQSLYAHLSSISCGTSGTLAINSLIGQSGGTNLAGEANFGVHLHLETRGASSSNTLVTRKYPPNFFLGSLPNSTRNQMSFINRTAASATSVTFKIAPVVLGTEYTTPLNKITFKYRADNGTWKTGTMTTSDEKLFTANIGSLYTNKIEYYVIAKSDAWVFGTWRDAYRPYRYSDAVPSDRPFVQYKTTASQICSIQNYEDYCTVIEPEDNNNNYMCQASTENETMRLVGRVISISEDWVITIKTQDNNIYSVIILDENATGSPITIGENIAIGCEVNPIDNSLSAFGADILVYSIYDGAEY